MAEGELRIKSDSIEKTTSAITALIGKLEDLDKNLDKVAKSTNDQAVSQNKTNTALKAAEIARKKAVDMLELHKQGLGKLSDAYAEEQAAIKAREIAAKKNIEVGSKEYQQLLDNVKAAELAAAASKRLALEEAEKARELTRAEKAAKLAEQATTKKTASEVAAEKALNSSNISRETSIKLLKLEEKGLDRLSDEYAEQRGAILGAQQAKLKGIKSGTDEYKQIVKNTTAIEKSTAARKRLQAAEAKATKGASGFTDSLDDMAKQAALVDGPLGGISSRLTTLSTILKSAGLGGALALTALGVGVGVLSFKLRDGVASASATEVSMKTLEAQLQQTGNTAGFTAEQLDNMARSVAFSTLNSVEGVRGSISSLLAFTNVSGDIFEEAVAKAEDIAILRKTGTSQVIKRLGKILDNPVARYKELAEWGIEFNETQEDALLKAKALGDVYGQQRVILDAVSERFTDVAVSQADTLAGDVDTFSQKWETYWEMMGKKGIPALRSVVQWGSRSIDVLNSIGETELDIDMKAFDSELADSSQSLEDLQEKLKIVQEYKDKMASGDFQLFPEDAVKDAERIAAEAQKMAFFNLLPFDVDYEPILTKAQSLLKQYTEQEQKLKEVIEARIASQNKDANKRTAEQEKSIKDIQEQVSSQIKLNDLFIKYGNTRSEEYIKEKAAIDGLEKAKKAGLEQDEEAVKIYQRESLALAILTEKRVIANTVIQKTKSLQSQQANAEREVALYKATTSGILENSDAYIQLAASLKTANEVKQMGGSLSSEQLKLLQAENLETLKLQRSISVLNALRAGDENSANVATLKRQIELQELLSSGIRKGSEEYIRQEERLKALDVVRKNNIAVGSEEYNQLLANAEAMAGYRSQLQRTQELADLGIVVRFDGMQQIEGSLEQIASAKAEALSNVQDLVNSGEIDSQEIGDKIKQQLNDYFLDEANTILLPLGFSQDLEGNQFLTESVEAVQAEYALKQKELEDARREGVITDKQAFDQRMLDVEREYQDKLAAMKIATWEKTAEAQALTRQGEVAGLVKDGAKMISAVAGNSKKLMKISKAAAIFESSAALVQSIAKASAVGWPANIPLIAEAFATGTQLVGQARSLNEPSFAFGGVDIQGAGTGRSDSISANIARGESVMTAPATARYKDTLQRMNAGLPLRQGGNSTFKSSPIINIQGDASERTVGLIEMKLRDYEDRVQQIAQGVSQQTIQEENEVGGFLNPI